MARNTLKAIHKEFRDGDHRADVWPDHWAIFADPCHCTPVRQAYFGDNNIAASEREARAAHAKLHAEATDD